MVQESLIEGIFRSLKKNSGWALLIFGLGILATVLINKYFPTEYETQTLLRVMTTENASSKNLAANMKGSISDESIIKKAFLENNIDPSLASIKLFSLKDAGPGLIKLSVKNSNINVLNEMRDTIIKVISSSFLGYNDEQRAFDLMALEKKKKHLESKLQNFRGRLAKININKVSHVDDGTLKLENKIRQLEDKIENNSKRLQIMPEVTFHYVTKKSSTYNRTARKLKSAKKDLTKLFEIYMQKHPKVVKKKLEIVKLERKAKRAKKRVKRRKNNPEYTALNSEIQVDVELLAGLRHSLEETRTSTEQLVSSQEQASRDLALEVSALEKIHQKTLLDLEEQKICQNTSLGKISVLKNGEQVPMPVGFSTIQRDFITLVSGVLIAVFLLYTPLPVRAELVSVSGDMLAGMSSNYQSPALQIEAVETILEVQALSVEPLALPAPEDRDEEEAPLRYDDRLIALNDPNSPMMAPYKSLVSNLQINISETQTRIVLVSSSRANSGKSSLISNTGILLAQAGYSVLMVDANFRNPSLHRIFDLENSKGLSDALADSKMDSLVQETCVPGLKVMSSGLTPVNPTEALGSIAMIELLSNLKRKIEIILVDTPALLDYPDTGVLAGHTGGVVFLHKNGEPEKDIMTSKRLLKKIRAKILGYVTA